MAPGAAAPIAHINSLFELTADGPARTAASPAGIAAARVLIAVRQESQLFPDEDERPSSPAGALPDVGGSGYDGLKGIRPAPPSAIERGPRRGAPATTRPWKADAEPPRGLEPLTYALQVRCAANCATAAGAAADHGRPPADIVPKADHLGTFLCGLDSSSGEPGSHPAGARRGAGLVRVRRSAAEREGVAPSRLSVGRMRWGWCAVCHHGGMSSGKQRLIGASDGATKGNPGPSAWAWVLADADGTVLRWRAGPLGRATNNIAELTALRELLLEVGPEVELEARLDSQYTINAVTKWLPAWKRNGWMTAGKKPVANAELIREIDALLATRNVRFVHVAAHQVNGDKYNDLADRAASAVAVSQTGLAGKSAAEVPGAPSRSAKPVKAASGRGGGASGGASAGGGTAAKAAGSDSSTKSGGTTAKKPFTIKAKFAGTCSCGRPYDAGEKIAKLAGSRWGHPGCG